MTTVLPSRVRSRTVALGAGLLLLLTAGCAVGVGNHSPPNPTVGQQLIDLQRAHQSGALSESEYETQRARLLSR